MGASSWFSHDPIEKLAPMGRSYEQEPERVSVRGACRSRFPVLVSVLSGAGVSAAPI